MKRSRRRAFVRCVLLGCLVSAVALTAPQRSTAGVLKPAELQKLYDSWQTRQNEIVLELKEGTPRTSELARVHAAALVQDVVDRAVAGPGMCKTAGRALTVLAIAEARLGDTDAGAWHWQMAQNVSGELGRFAFREFPDVAAFMKTKLIPDARWDPSQGDVPRQVVGHPETLGDPVVPPCLRNKIDMAYPAGLIGLRVSARTVVTFLVDEEGSVREPVVVRSSGYVAFDVAVMEAAGRACYEPASRGGEPIRVYLVGSYAMGNGPWSAATEPVARYGCTCIDSHPRGRP